MLYVVLLFHSVIGITVVLYNIMLKGTDYMLNFYDLIKVTLH